MQTLNLINDEKKSINGMFNAKKPGKEVETTELSPLIVVKTFAIISFLSISIFPISIEDLVKNA